MIISPITTNDSCKADNSLGLQGDSGSVTEGPSTTELTSELSVDLDLEDNPRDFYPRFFRLGLVNILSNLMVPLAGLVDVAFLGHLDDLKYLAGVAIATVLFDYLYRMAKFLRMGTTGPTAQAEGRDDPTEVVLTLLRNGLLAIAMGLVILALQVPLREVGFAILSAAPEVKAAGMDYFNARIWGAPAVLLNLVFIGWFVGREQGGKVLALSLVGNQGYFILKRDFSKVSPCPALR